jgi:zinc transporter, ZIP family
MLASISNVFAYSLIPAAAVLIGGLLATVRTPGPSVRSVVQHFTSGLLFAVVGTELLPDVMHRRLPFATIIGFALGVAVMLGLKAFATRREKLTDSGSARPSSLLLVMAVDIAVDGLLIGVGFALGAKQGLLITIALTLEVLFLGVSTAIALGGEGASRTKIIGTTASLAGLLLIGSVAGTLILSGVSGAVLDAVLSFGMAAILYLVTEELLVEAHEVEETPFLTATFFAGFMVLPVVDMLS